MRIEKFKKRPNGLYTIYLDNFNSYDFYEEIILKYELLITKTIEEDELNKIIEDNKNYESYYDALKTLKRTIKTKEEIRKKLTEKKYSKESIDFAITTLEKQGNLTKTLSEVGKILTAREQQRKKLFSLLQYPLILLGMLGVVICGLILFVFPELKVWQGERQTLPLIHMITLGATYLLPLSLLALYFRG